MKSPDFILPLLHTHHKPAILNDFATLKLQMKEAAETLDLGLICKSFEFPGFGFLTRLEWLNFFLVHTQRHTRQLEKIVAILNEKV